MLSCTVFAMRLTAGKLADKFQFTLTPLRKDVLTIFLKAKKPLTAYEVLALLSKTRPNAKPPTVYRVLAFLNSKCVLHRINNINSYMLCQMDKHDHGTCEVMVLCENCHQVVEFSDTVLAAMLCKLAGEHNVKINTHLIELSGLCKKCLPR